MSEMLEAVARPRWGPPPNDAARVAVVIPCHRVKRHVLQVIAGIPSCVERIYVVDDACPERSGDFVHSECVDPRVRVVRNAVNQGVGGATLEGYRHALAEGFDIVVKMDGDGQMDGGSVSRLIAPILSSQADYAKGNRFYDLAEIHRMPIQRLLGNAALSFLAKLSTGYWHLFDPTNGFTAVHARVLGQLPLDRIDKRYFFESDLLFRLSTVRAAVVDVPMHARYGDERSGFNALRMIPEFSVKHMRNIGKRVFYNYLLRDVSLASVELALGLVFVLAGCLTGVHFWHQSYATGITASAGSVMLAALQVIVGIQLLLGFLAYDIASVPGRAIHVLLPAPDASPGESGGKE